MFDKFRLKEVLVEYKKRFVQQQWPNEKYKWEAVQCFQLNWDVNSDDFAQMLTKSLAQTANLLTSVNNFPEDWLELLTDKDVFNESSLEIMKRMKDYGGRHLRQRDLHIRLWVRRMMIA